MTNKDPIGEEFHPPLIDESNIPSIPPVESETLNLCEHCHKRLAAYSLIISDDLEEEKETIERVSFALKHFYSEHNGRFESGSVSGEYYGRGGLEGLAVGIYAVLGRIPDWITDKALRAYLEIWGADRFNEVFTSNEQGEK